MSPTPIIDMFSRTGELARRYLRERFSLGVQVASVLARDLEDEEIRLFQTWENVTGAYAPPTGQTCQFMHWMMGLPHRGLDALGRSVSAQRRLAGNAVVRLMLQRGLTAINNERNL